MVPTAAKLVQRRLYSWLSSRRGLPVCIVGLMVLAISMFQFGEVLLEWSKERYAAQFSIYHDNIAGRSFEKHICPDLPIDVVYTWVNGSDPKLIYELKILKEAIDREAALERQNNQQHNDTNTTASPTAADIKCPFTNCVTWRALVLDAHNLTNHTLYSSLPHPLTSAISIQYLNITDHATPVYVARLPSEQHVTDLLADKHLPLSTGERNISITRGYLTSDKSLVGTVEMSLYGIARSESLQSSDHTHHSELVDTIQLATGVMVEEVDVVDQNLAWYKLKEAIHYKNVSSGLTFRNMSLSLYPAYAVWMAFSLPGSSEPKHTDMSENRFQDNEELRYSLRSIEHHAPWIRHIYIVTNGQIPHWLNLDSPRISIITHNDIFRNTSHLPTYSSPAIESHLHHIPGLSKWFLYLNDDVMLGQDVWPQDFFTPLGGQKVYLSWSVPNCAEGCPPNWIGDKYCDTACNTSSCDWDGGDCANRTKPGPLHGYGHSWSSPWRSSHHASTYCNGGCLTSWLGDRYCDSSCRVPQCGYDAGDCGTNGMITIYHTNINNNNYHNHTFIIPLETSAMYFNLSQLFLNGSITSSTYSSSPIIRSAVFAVKYSTLSLTFFPNITRSSSHFTITGKATNQSVIRVNFTVIADTTTINTTLHTQRAHGWSFPAHNNTDSSKFLKEVAIKIQDSDYAIERWLTERPSLTNPTLPPTLYPNYTLTNLTMLPGPVAQQLHQLRKDLNDGVLTARGYLKQQAMILDPYKHLVETATDHGPPGTRRKLMMVPSDEWVGQQVESPRLLPWERLRVFPDMRTNPYLTTPLHRRHLMDTFGDSLRHVNKLFNKQYGHKPRKVPAHIPHMINKNIMEQLQQRYPSEFDMTSSHKLRSSDDMQFAFSYFYFMMSEKLIANYSAIFTELDTDKTGILSVRELRTLLARVEDVPITLSDIHRFEEMLHNCSTNYTGPVPHVDPMDYETHYDPDLPLVTEQFFLNCSALLHKINISFGERTKYKYQEMGEDDVAFKMLNENGSKIIEQLDWVRRHTRKFICLNDNMDHTKEEAQFARMLLLDFYESLFPLPSQFELSPNYRNRFLYTSDLEQWIEDKNKVQFWLHMVCAVLLLVCVFSLFYGKLVQAKRRFSRWAWSCIRGDRLRTQPV